MSTIPIDEKSLRDLNWLVQASASLIEELVSRSPRPIEFEFPADPEDPDSKYVVVPCADFSDRLRNHPVLLLLQAQNESKH